MTNSSAHRGFAAVLAERLCLSDLALKASRGFAAVLAERLCLSDLALKASRGYAARGRASRKVERIDGKPEAFRKNSGKAANRLMAFGCGLLRWHREEFHISALSTTTYEVHYLNPIIISQNRLIPS